LDYSPAREQEKTYVYLLTAGIRLYNRSGNSVLYERRINQKEAGCQKEKEGIKKGMKK
jgi:hypothetical protein